MKTVIVVAPSIFMAVTGLTPMAGEAADQQHKVKACNEQANAKGLGKGRARSGRRL